jgi:hypothetical protein
MSFADIAGICTGPERDDYTFSRPAASNSRHLTTRKSPGGFTLTDYTIWGLAWPVLLLRFGFGVLVVRAKVAANLVQEIAGNRRTDQ